MLSKFISRSVSKLWRRALRYRVNISFFSRCTSKRNYSASAIDTASRYSLYERIWPNYSWCSYWIWLDRMKSTGLA